MRKKILICIGVLCLVLLACLPLFLGPLEPLEDEIYMVMGYNQSSNCLEFYSDRVEDMYPLTENARVYYDGFAPDSYGVESELFFSAFFEDPLLLKLDNNATIGDDDFFYITYGLRIYGVDLSCMGVNDGRLVLELPSGETYVSTDRRFTEEKLKELFDGVES
ncbi:MAG: hypothetical protein IJX28_02130 [Clostridia bacterium]|nr:hypothetical protein [Clostridia bacterium]